MYALTFSLVTFLQKSNHKTELEVQTIIEGNVCDGQREEEQE